MSLISDERYKYLEELGILWQRVQFAEAQCATTKIWALWPVRVAEPVTIREGNHGKLRYLR
jgi:hypothetical protein